MTRREMIAGSALWAAGAAAAPAGETQSIVPQEDTQAVLHNRDMGWVVYENYPLDPRPGGGGSLTSLPEETFPAVDAVAIMFSWYDVEKQPGEYDFSKMDHAYDWWRKRGKAIHLRMSCESLLWWTRRQPPAGKGIPDYVLAKLPADRQQTRQCEGIPYVVVDAREPCYRERLERFLAATAAHYSGERAVSLVDLRGFGLWGEWHSGYRYPTVAERRAALAGILDTWSAAFPRNWLALSYSYDPDGPETYHAGPTDRLDPRSTGEYDGYRSYSAFAHALAKRNITLRRDGAGGAVHSNERKLCEEAFATLARGPMMCEFVGGYAAAKKGRQGWVDWMVSDALSLHPNYVNVLGWQNADARDFLRERPDLVERGLRTMGYRLVPVRVTCPRSVRPGAPFRLAMEWANRGVGRAARDFRLRVSLAREGRPAIEADAGPLPTSRWIKGKSYAVEARVTLPKAPPGRHELRLALADPASKTRIALPLAGRREDGSYAVTAVDVSLR